VNKSDHAKTSFLRRGAKSISPAAVAATQAALRAIAVVLRAAASPFRTPHAPDIDERGRLHTLFEQR
jgi:hypothetical protein